MARVVLNRALVLETADQLPDGAGGYSQTWRALGTLWAAVEPRSGREREKEERPQHLSFIMKDSQ